jgi:hypothetical protein
MDELRSLHRLIFFNFESREAESDEMPETAHECSESAEESSFELREVNQ